jgi:hypothetical protein
MRAAEPAGWTVATVGVAVLGLGLAVAKAATVPISADEAWSWTDWISHGFGFIWTHYSAANNHVLETLLARASVVVFGDTPFTLRLPTLAGFAVLLAAGAVLSRIVIERPLFRFLFVAALALHPYLIDFAACARGYMLGLGFAFTGLLILTRALVTRPTGTLLASASLALGLATASVLIFASFAVSALAAYVWLASPRPPDLRRTLLVLAGPMVAVLLVIYGGVLGQLGRKRLGFGAGDVWSSLASLHALLVYTPQGVVDRLANPALDQPVVPWQRGPLPATFHAVFDAGLVDWLGAAAAVVAILLAVRRLDIERNRARALPAVTLLVLLVALIAQSVVLRLPWPLHRTWLPVVPLLFLSILVGADSLARESHAPFARATTALVTIVWLLFLVNGAARIRLTAFREWPDQAVVPDALAAIARQRPPETSVVTLGHPWYLHTCLRYYAAHGGFGWLRIPHQERAELPLWDFILVNRRMPAPPGYEPVKRYDEVGITLLRRTAPTG